MYWCRKSCCAPCFRSPPRSAGLRLSRLLPCRAARRPGLRHGTAGATRTSETRHPPCSCESARIFECLHDQGTAMTIRMKTALAAIAGCLAAAGAMAQAGSGAATDSTSNSAGQSSNSTSGSATMASSPSTGRAKHAHVKHASRSTDPASASGSDAGGDRPTGASR